MNVDSHQHRLFLKSLEILAEKYHSRDDHSFNVFCALRSPSDEVNLHSRFLIALLNHCKPGDECLRNLSDFLEKVCEFERKRNFGDCALGSVHVEREMHNIDILILHRKKKEAVIIENKIYARDQPKQLQKYAQTLKEDGIPNPHLVYLTLDGHEPSEDSKGNYHVELISYKDQIVPWLERCQERAYDEPELRETISQYIALIRELTGIGIRGEHMKELMKLVLEGENIGLAFDLDATMLEAKVFLLKELWKDIETALKDQIDEGSFPFDGKETPMEGYGVNESNIWNFFTSRKIIWYGMWYRIGPPFEGARLGIEIGYEMIYGVRCDEGNTNSRLYTSLQRLDKELGPSKDSNNYWWPWCQQAGRDSREEFNFRKPNRECLLFLSDRVRRKEFSEDVAKKTVELWQTLQNLSN